MPNLAWQQLREQCDYDFEFEHVVQVPPVPIGIKALDDALGGGVPIGTFTAIGGEGGAGKSALAVIATYEAAYNGRCPVYFSLEMPHQMVINRLLSVHARRFNLQRVLWSKTRSIVERNISSYNDGKPKDMRRSIRTQEDVDWYLATYGSHDSAIAAWRHFRDTVWPRMIVYDRTVSIDWICGMVRTMVADGLRPMPIIDYVQLAPYEGDASEYEAVTSASAALQSLTKDCNIPCIALSSLRNITKAERGEPPTQNMLRGSGHLGYDAGAVIILTKDGDRVPEVQDDRSTVSVQPVIAHIVKNRSGSSNVQVPLTFDGGMNEFR